MLCTDLHRMQLMLMLMLCFALLGGKPTSIISDERVNRGKERRKGRRKEGTEVLHQVQPPKEEKVMLMQSCRAQLQINNRLMCQAKYSHHHHHDHHLVVNPLLNDITKRQIFLPLNLITLLSRRRCKRRGIKSLLRSSSKRALARAPLNRKSHKRRVYAPLVNAHESFSVN